MLPSKNIDGGISWQSCNHSCLSLASTHALVVAVYTIGQLLSIPLSKEKQQYLKQASQGLEAQNGQQSPFPASHYVLNQEMMSKLGYPVTKDGLLPEGFVETRVSSSGQRLMGSPTATHDHRPPCCKFYCS